MYSNSTFLTPSISNSYLCVLDNRLPRLARYLQAVFIVTNSFGSLNKLETWNLKLQAKWRENVAKTRRKDSNVAGFRQLVEFVENAAEKANDPIYGKEALNKAKQWTHGLTAETQNFHPPSPKSKVLPPTWMPFLSPCLHMGPGLPAEKLVQKSLVWKVTWSGQLQWLQKKICGREEILLSWQSSLFCLLWRKSSVKTLHEKENM